MYQRLLSTIFDFRDMEKQKNVIIVGAGLSGLYLAYQLQKKNITSIVLEASPRLGGRIQTISGMLGTPMELGATWFSDAHRNLLSLIDELGLKTFHQYSKGISLFQTKSFEPPQKFFVPESDAPSYRLAGGTQQLIDSLVKKMPDVDILVNKPVVEVKDLGASIEVLTKGGDRYYGDHVAIGMPPQLAAETLSFHPSLPVETTAILPAVQTWMAGAIKFTIEYEYPFWRNKGYSGMVYSHSGIITEMYDHTNFQADRFGFTGFLNGAAATYDPSLRKELVITQLSELLGDDSKNFSYYTDKIWNDQFLIAGSPLFNRPHQNNGHPLLQQSYMDGKLFFCGTETAAEFGGYMEGAVLAAKNLTEKIIKKERY